MYPHSVYLWYHSHQRRIQTVYTRGTTHTRSGSTQCIPVVPLTPETDPDSAYPWYHSHQRRIHTVYTCGTTHTRGGSTHFHKKKRKSDFEAICFKKNQEIPGRNSKRKLQNMVKRKMTRTKLEIFC